MRGRDGVLIASATKFTRSAAHQSALSPCTAKMRVITNRHIGEADEMLRHAPCVDEPWTVFEKVRLRGELAAATGISAQRCDMKPIRVDRWFAVSGLPFFGRSDPRPNAAQMPNVSQIRPAGGPVSRPWRESALRGPQNSEHYAPGYRRKTVTRKSTPKFW